jgi:cell wall-associated NlpC family hydrolase
MASTPVIPVAVVVGGAYLAWFGVHYWRTDVAWPSDPVKAVLTGQPLPAVTKDDSALLTTSVLGPGLSIAQEATAAGAVGTGPGADIAHDALKYQGAGYVYGGKADVPGNWDCSSFVSKVLGQDFGMMLPGGGKWGDPGYPPNSHGPGSTAYMLYGTGITLAQIMPGDLIVSTGHIGICIGNGEMISAEDPQYGTRIGTFPAGFPEGPPVYRRVAGAPAGALG